MFGLSGSSKSMFTKLMYNAFAGFCGQMSANELLFNENAIDPAMRNRSFYLNRFCRLIFASEISKGDKKQEKYTDGNLVKSITGNERLVGREMRQNEVHFTPLFTLFCACNDIPKFSPYDDSLDDRLRIYRYPNKFVYNPISSKDERMRDSKVDDYVSTNECKIALYDLLLCLMPEMYEKTHNGKQLVSIHTVIEEPKLMREEKRRWTSEESFEDKFLSRFVLDSEGCVPVTEVELFRKTYFKTVSKSRFEEDLQRLGIKEKKRKDLSEETIYFQDLADEIQTSPYSKYQKDIFRAKKQYRCYLGIRYKTQADLHSEEDQQDDKIKTS